MRRNIGMSMVCTRLDVRSAMSCEASADEVSMPARMSAARKDEVGIVPDKAGSKERNAATSAPSGADDCSSVGARWARSLDKSEVNSKMSREPDPSASNCRRICG
eukprot:scaffold79061_cov30-Tisochrysis_lutea.AAC.1